MFSGEFGTDGHYLGSLLLNTVICGLLSSLFFREFGKQDLDVYFYISHMGQLSYGCEHSRLNQTGLGVGSWELKLQSLVHLKIGGLRSQMNYELSFFRIVYNLSLFQVILTSVLT